MIPCRRKYEAVDYVYNEMTAKQRQDYEHHVAECDQCRDQVDQLQFVNSVAETYRRPEPDKKLLQQYHRALREKYGSGKRFSFKLEHLKEKFITRPTIGIRFAEAFAILVIGIFIGKMTLWKSESLTKNGGLENATMTSAAVESLLLNNYLQEAEMVLLDVANLDPVDDHSVILDLKKIAEYRRLLQKTMICREHARSSHDEKLENLLNQIELILIELCNIEQVSLDESVLSLKQQLDDTNLLYSIKHVNQNKI
ncbi:MAG: anti-sigma factor family protein [Candidatus Zhuqueibacterota bacterium]